MHPDNAKSGTDVILSTLLPNHQRFLRFLEARIGNRQDAEEILQTAFVRSIQQADAIRDAEKTTAWFYRLLRNSVIDHYRSKAARHGALEKFAQQISRDDESVDPALERVICECVKELLPILKPEYAALITKVDLEGNDVASIADLLGITPGNARVRLHRARAALRQEVERMCRTCATHGCMDCTCGEKGSSREQKE